MKSVKYFVITECGKQMRIVSKRFKYFITHKRREKKIDDAWDECHGFCPMCKYAEACMDILERIENLNK